MQLPSGLVSPFPSSGVCHNEPGVGACFLHPCLFSCQVLVEPFWEEGPRGPFKSQLDPLY